MDESLKAQLQATLDMIPAFTWLAAPSGALLFVNSRCADYLGLSKDHPLRFGTVTGAVWDSHIPFLHPDDHEEMRRVGSDNLRTGGTAEASCRIRDAQGNYRWFLSPTEPLRRKQRSDPLLDRDQPREHEVLTSALRKSEGELRQVLDLVPQIIGVLGPERERLYANRGALTYYGISLD